MNRLSRQRQLRRRVYIGAAVGIVTLIIIIIAVVLSGADSSKDAEVYKPGVFTEDGYESEVADFCYVTPNGGKLATERELAELIGISNELMSGSFKDWKLYYEKQATVYDMLASMPSGSNVNVIWSRVAKETTEQEMIDRAILDLESLEFMDVTVREGTNVSTIAGREYTRFVAETTMNDIDMIQEYYVNVENGQCISITLTYFEGMDADRIALMDGFKEKNRE